MFREITFKTALAISFSLHLLLLSPWHALQFAKIEEEKNEVEVTYILDKLIKTEFELENLPQKYDLEKKKLEEPRGKQEKTEKENAIQAEIPEKEERFLKEEDAKKLEEYISYYELIREKIKKCVTQYYTKPAEKGRVDVMFGLDKKGAMKELNITQGGSSQNQYLDRIAVKAVRAASPFPPFPAALKKEELTFTISIIFKNE